MLMEKVFSKKPEPFEEKVSLSDYTAALDLAISSSNEEVRKAIEVSCQTSKSKSL
jgi:hypothetical protein